MKRLLFIGFISNVIDAIHIEKQFDSGFYTGEATQDGTKPHGHGTMLYANGDVYEGAWNEGRKHGLGIHKDRNGNVYEGLFDNALRHGRGIMKYPDAVYDGVWEHNTKNGRGTYKHQDGSSYDGEWLNDKKHGWGTFKYRNDKLYVGEWLDDKRHGRGTLTRIDGSSYVSEWRDDKELKQCRLINAAQPPPPPPPAAAADNVDNKAPVKVLKSALKARKPKHIEMQLDDGFYSGQEWPGEGTMVYKNGNVYQGAFDSGKAHGRGTMRFYDGSEYEGEFNHGKRHGRGTSKFPNGNVYENIWCDDRIQHDSPCANPVPSNPAAVRSRSSAGSVAAPAGVVAGGRCGPMGGSAAQRSQTQVVPASEHAALQRKYEKETRALQEKLQKVESESNTDSVRVAPSAYYQRVDCRLDESDVRLLFHHTVDRSEWEIVEIENVMDKGQNNRYELRLRDKCNAYRRKRDVLERYLWHGSSLDVTQKVIANGFDRSYSQNAAYGRGNYFARDAGYSAADRYSPPHSDGFKYMLLCKVLVGDSVLGHQGMTAFPLKPDGKTEYDSLVNDVQDPKIFVTWRDETAVPMFRIKFRPIAKEDAWVY